MSEANMSMAAVAGPSKQQVVKATVIAALVAAVIFFTVVLPAEYGKDPLHTGAALGLMNLSKAAPEAAASAPIAVATEGIPAGKFTVIQPTKEGDAPIIQGVYVPQPHGYKVDSRELKLGIGEGMEIKYHMAGGAGMVYSWTADKRVQFEFHGEPDVKPAGAGEDYFESYQKDDSVGATESHGTFTAPSTGIEGWFWDNESGAPVTIKLTTAGFYDYILQNKDDVKTKLPPPADPK